nr:MAG TPA: hypothetical protein [Caudoviricetes sp.]
MLLRRVATLFRVFFGLIFRVCLRIGENDHFGRFRNRSRNCS